MMSIEEAKVVSAPFIRPRESAASMECWLMVSALKINPY